MPAYPLVPVLHDDGDGSRRCLYVNNMMSSPGAGKTALLEHTLDKMLGRLRIGILEGDVQTTLDPGFGGGCNLDANMVRSGLAELPCTTSTYSS